MKKLYPDLEAVKKIAGEGDYKRISVMTPDGKKMIENFMEVVKHD